MRKKIIESILKDKTQSLDESWLNRIWNHIQKHDVALISAGRAYIKNCYKAKPDNIENKGHNILSRGVMKRISDRILNEINLL